MGVFDTESDHAQAGNNVSQIGMTNAKSAKNKTVRSIMKDPRGTTTKTAPLESLSPIHPLTPTAALGGKTPLGNDKGPAKKMQDNIMNKNKRDVRSKFDPPTSANDRNHAIGIAHFGQSAPQRVFGAVKRFFGQDARIGDGIEVASMFETSKKPVEVACNDKSGMFVSSEDKWIQKAVPKSHEGKFTAKAEKAGKSVQGFASQVLSHPGDFSEKTRKQAQFAKTMQKMNK